MTGTTTSKRAILASFIPLRHISFWEYVMDFVEGSIIGREAH